MNESSAIQPEDLLDSWKDIAAYLKRDISTVQRWERREDMPVHRHVHDVRGRCTRSDRSSMTGWNPAGFVWSRRRIGARLRQPSRLCPPSITESLSAGTGFWRAR